MFNGYLLKGGVTGTMFPEQYIEFGSYESSPNQRQDKDSTRDMNGILRRNVVLAMPTSIKFTTRDVLPMDGKQAIQAFFNANMVNAAERKVYIEYWNDENNAYETGYFYLPDIRFPVLWHSATTIYYGSIEIDLIGYGE